MIAIIVWLTVTRIMKRMHISIDELSIETGREDSYENVDLKQALNALPQEDKAVIELRYFEDLPLNRIAEILGENLSTVKSRLYRGLKKMKLEHIIMQAAVRLSGQELERINKKKLAQLTKEDVRGAIARMEKDNLMQRGKTKNQLGFIVTTA